MRDRLEQLAAASSDLEPERPSRAQLLDAVTEYAQHFIDQIPARPAYVSGTAASDSHSLEWEESGCSIHRLMDALGTVIDRPGINPTSDRFLGFIPGGGLFHAALGDFLAAVSNRYAGYHFASPGAVRLENKLLAWIASVVGFPQTALGNLTSGGSVAHLVAIATARETMNISPEKVPCAAIYATREIHHCIDKALRVAGLATCPRREIPVDADYRMSPSALDATIQHDQQKGLRPWLVLASAGTVNTGAIDPLAEIAAVARKHRLWFHLDAAYGGFFALCDLGRRRLDGMSAADSIVVDPHKTLFLPYGTGAVLVREGRHLLRTFAADPDYLQDGRHASDDISPADVSIELTKHFRGLRMWLPLKLIGVAPFRAALEEKLLLAEYFHRQIGRLEGFRLGPPPQLAVATFWYQPKQGDANQFNRQLLAAIQSHGQVMLTSTMLKDRFVIRLAVGVYRTHLPAIETALQVVQETAHRLDGRQA